MGKIAASTLVAGAGLFAADLFRGRKLTAARIAELRRLLAKPRARK
ncbi:MAG: hypothetical protein ACJ8F7_00825 [Gemmataceae bacterium]